MNKEIFKPIIGYDGLYEVSNKGNVKILSKILKCRNGGERVVKERISSLNHTNKDGYVYVTLSKDNKKKTFKVHKLVADAFIEKKGIKKNIIVDHIDSNRSNNCLNNLQRITQRTNVSKDKKNKTSKYTGVSWSKKSSKWISHIKINGKSKHLGLFDSEECARDAYLDIINNLNL